MSAENDLGRVAQPDEVEFVETDSSGSGVGG